MDNSWKWIIKRHWVELCLADVVTNIAEILKHFFQQVTIGCLATKLCHTQRSKFFPCWCKKDLINNLMELYCTVMRVLPPHQLDSSWSRLHHPTHGDPTPQPWKKEKLEAEGGRGQSGLSCSPSPVCDPPCSLLTLVLVHRAHLVLSSRSSLIGLVFSHTNLSGAEEEILESSKEWVGLRWPMPWNQGFEKHGHFLCPSCWRAGSTPKNALASIVIAWSAMACLHHLLEYTHFLKRTWSWARLQPLQDSCELVWTPFLASSSWCLNVAGPQQTVLHVTHGKCPIHLPGIQGKQTVGQFHSHDTKSNFNYFHSH